MSKPFNLWFALLSVVVDLSAIVLGMVAAYYLRAEGTSLYYWPFSTYLLFVAAMLPLWIILLASQGLYDLRNMPRGFGVVGRTFVGLLSGWGAMLIILYLWRSPQALAFPRLVIAYGLFFTLSFVVLGRLLLAFLLQQLYARGIGSSRTVILANGGPREFTTALQSDPRYGRDVAGVVRGNYLERLKNFHRSKPLDEIIVNDPKIDEPVLLAILSWAEQRGIHVTLVPSLFSVRTTNVETGSLAGTPVMYVLRTPLEGWRRVYKRLFDILLVAPAILVLAPVYLLVALLVKLSSSGPVLYRQPRVGQDGKVFYIHKFRSMRQDAESQGRDWTVENDPRITPIGRFLRASNVDELPQLFDILMGSMSLVGPRPEQPQYVEKFSQEVPDYLRRHHVKSGLTGWAQVNGLRGDTSIPERVKYDLYYIENWSLWFDVRILLATVSHVFGEFLGSLRPAKDPRGRS